SRWEGGRDARLHSLRLAWVSSLPALSVLFAASVRFERDAEVAFEHGADLLEADALAHHGKIAEIDDGARAAFRVGIFRGAVVDRDRRRGAHGGVDVAQAVFASRERAVGGGAENRTAALGAEARDLVMEGAGIHQDVEGSVLGGVFQNERLDLP